MRNLRLLIFICFLSGLTPFFASAASQAGLFLNPATGSFLVGSTFDLSIILDTKGAAINTIEIELLFPADKVQVSSPSVGRSIIQLWPAPPAFSNQEGRIYFIGGIPSPGIVTSQGIVLTLTFRVISPGEGQIKFGEKTRVLANDGRGTNVLGQMPPAFFKFLIPPPQGPPVSSPTHPDQERWYRDTNPVFVWPKTQFASAYSYSIDRDPSGFPDTTAEGTSPTVSFQNLDNGIWYFYLRESAGGVWGGVSHYVVKIDNQPPASFQINVSPALRTTNPNPIFRFFTTDSLSGFDHFEMKIISLSSGEVTEALFFEVSSPYQSINLEKGRYQVIVRALDAAGNSRDEAVTSNIVSPLFQFITPEGLDLVFIFLPWSWILLTAGILLFVFLVIISILWGKHKHHIKHAFKEDILQLLHLMKKHPPAILVLIISLFLLANVVSAIENKAAEEILSTPTISIYPDVYYPLDEVLYLEGRAKPNSNIQIQFQKQGEKPVKFNSKSDSNGEWVFAEKVQLEAGDWEVRTRLAVENEKFSEWSNPRVFKAVITGITIGGVNIKFAILTLLIVVLLVLGVIIVLYFNWRIRKLKNALISKEVREAHESVRKGLSELRNDLLEELKIMESKGQLTPEEIVRKERILRELERVGTDVEREIGDIEEKL